MYSMFIRQLLDWKIDYKNLKPNKAGAGCINSGDISYHALGLSYNLVDIDYAKKLP